MVVLYKICNIMSSILLNREIQDIHINYLTHFLLSKPNPSNSAMWMVLIANTISVTVLNSTVLSVH